MKVLEEEEEEEEEEEKEAVQGLKLKRAKKIRRCGAEKKPR